MPKATMPKDHPSAGLVIAGQRAEPRKPIDVDDDTAAGLAEQGWTIAADKPAPKKKTDASTDADTKES